MADYPLPPAKIRESVKLAPFWWEAAEPDPISAEDPPESADVVIIGGGYTGLNAALELARAGVDALVLDADRIGFGASTRSGGMVSGGVNLGNKGKSLPESQARAMMEEAKESYRNWEAIIERERIDCDYQKTGRFVGAHCRKAYGGLQARIDTLNAQSPGSAWLVPEAEMRNEIHSDHYRGGFTTTVSGGVHPARYHQGLAKATRAAGAATRDGIRVTGVSGKRGAFTVHTERGDIKATEVLAATNGYTGGATPALQRRVIPVASHIIATEELGEDVVKDCFPTLRMTGDTNRLLNYYRPSPCRKRIIFGGRASFRAGIQMEECAAILYRRMTSIFPQVMGCQLTHAWTGNVGFTFDFTPHLGEREGIHYALGCNGSGVVMMSHLGRQVARKIIGGNNTPSAFDSAALGHAFTTRPLYYGTPWFLPSIGRWYALRDWLDRKLDGA
ncbi:MAG: FAD-binding oxidoreductase [Alphaproteobacteria bacterium]|nr:FAD-binding oxidoreductase [Alphaproteobacteria bacterium]